jgi:hypothetical protein
MFIKTADAYFAAAFKQIQLETGYFKFRLIFIRSWDSAKHWL